MTIGTSVQYSSAEELSLLCSAESQPTQLIEDALAAPQERVEQPREQTHRQPQANDRITNDFSADSIAPPRRETATRYRLCDHADQNKGSGPTQWGSQKENTSGKDTKPSGARSLPHDASKTRLSLKETNPDAFDHPVPFTASSTGREIGEPLQRMLSSPIYHLVL